MRARSRIAVLAAGTLGLSLALVSTGSLSTANADGPTAQPAGQLVLSTTSGTAGGDTWTYGTTTQAVATSGATSCSVTSPTGTLVNVTSVNGSPGFANHSLGVTQSGTVSTDCRQVGIYKVKVGGVTTTKVESIAIALNTGTGGAFTSPEFGASKATSATFDLELKDETKVRADLYDGTTLVGSSTMYTDEDPKPANFPASIRYCRNGLRDSGSTDPNGPKDNCRWTVSPTAGAYFDSVVLTPLLGAFSVEGGGDWGAAAASNRTTFDIVQFYDGTTVCNQAITIQGAGALTGSLTPLEVPGATCTPGTPYTVDSTADGLTFHKPATADAKGQYALEVTRTFAQGELTSFPAPGLTVDWEAGEGALDLALCPTGLIGGIDSGTGNPTSIDISVIGTTDQSAGRPDQQYACIYNPGLSYDNSNGVLTTTDWIWFTGDILVGTKR